MGTPESLLSGGPSPTLPEAGGPPAPLDFADEAPKGWRLVPQSPGDALTWLPHPHLGSGREQGPGTSGENKQGWGLPRARPIPVQETQILPLAKMGPDPGGTELHCRALWLRRRAPCPQPCPPRACVSRDSCWEPGRGRERGEVLVPSSFHVLGNSLPHLLRVRGTAVHAI